MSRKSRRSIEKVARGFHGLDSALLVESAAQDLDRLGVRHHLGLLQGGLGILDHATAILVVGVGTLDDLVEPPLGERDVLRGLDPGLRGRGKGAKRSPGCSSS